MGKEQKKGKKGIAANYTTRNRAVRKLQISLKDFRRLCILKGIYPRDPKKKSSGKDKTYYHVKDIKFLSHEPLLNKFRDLKVFLRRRKKAQIKKDVVRMAHLEKGKPKMNLDHLVKERYPTFVDALRDFDDPLCMVYLFASLPVKLTRDHKPEMVALVARLVQEFESYVFRTKSLRKVFVSIKGMYYQAVIQGQPITWLAPHKFKQVIPADVDIRVMITFLEFYITMVKFTTFKLYHDLGLKYPPKIDQLGLARRAGLQSLKMELLSGAPETKAVTAPSAPAASSKEQKAVEAVVQGVLKNLKDQPTGDEEVEEEKPAEDQLDDFSQLDKSTMSPDEIEKEQYSQLFKGLTFILARETPLDSLEFIILCGAGQVLREDQIDEEQYRSETITHHVMDRPKIKNKIFSRQYLQPQWVYDSFNAKALLPIYPYAPGVKPPPHLSPFVDDEAEGYVPAQRKVLEEWGAAKAPGSDPKDEEGAMDTKDEEEEVNDEEAYAKDLANERAGLLYSQTEHEAEAEGDMVDEGEDDEGDEGDMEGDSEEEEEEELVIPQKPVTQSKKEQEEEELRKMMMGKKDTRLYSRMQYGIKKKEDAVALLEAKRAQIEKKGKPKKGKK